MGSAAALAAFAVYAWLCPSVPGPGDSSEITLVLATNGVAHPTGYPLYTLLGHGFCLLLHAFGASWFRAANLWSAAGGAVAVGLLVALAARWTDERSGSGAARILSALVPVALFAFQPVLLDESVAAEVNSWSTAWACGAALVFTRMCGALAQETSASRRRAGAALWGATCGVGLAHHTTSVLVAVPLTIGLAVVLARRRQLRLPLVGVAAAGALVPLASYGIIAWRAWHPVSVQWPSLEASMGSVVDHITGEQYRHFLGYFAPAPEQVALLDHVAYPILFAGLLLLLLQAIRAASPEQRVRSWSLLAAALLVTGFTFGYGVPDPATYFLPAMALGAAAAAPALHSAAVPRLRGAAWRLGALGALSLVALVPWIREGNAERSSLVMDEAMLHSMWSAIPPDSAIVFWHDDRYIRLRAYQILDGEKPALTVLTPDLLLEHRTRNEFRRRFGIDPLEGARLPRVRPGSPEEATVIRESLRRLVAHVNARTRVPVIVFDPTIPIVTQLRKPWEPPPSRPRRARPRRRMRGRPRRTARPPRSRD
jgi:hypothetical protein